MRTGAAVGGLVGLAALILFCMWCIEYRKTRKARRVQAKAQQAGLENASELRPMNVQPPAQLATSHAGYAHGNGDYASARSV
ncbi:hypothetical protein EWM64_g5159 [Hericium alpestre]|uniref:Uncharacterized protein n=1 Tax=Hericium alpestre TaxID=135208 RepID=A0A4Y9ZXQ8_9AGAM|nr:hypothetical protein EWM64_g5159 [Hericium alpestre]